MMVCAAASFAKEAEKLVGAPFRLRGRDPATGLDCVGLVLTALERAGLGAVEPPFYGLRNRSCEAQFASLPASGFIRANGCRGAVGDLLIVEPGPAQWHVVIRVASEAFVHAHAGRRQVVRHRGRLPWLVSQCWRLA
ncbi:hypothetical protein GRI38_09015 [Altererythrobacter aurantiacus]|uniref:NlpC/P60 domain-containing protein n=1 Tax=Parapontixanthobacter aurantiacus TaxID=1463599 RepID=A0A844ZEF8_9SPHN|nr:C40 family peptidase [Parapontixanthobacter aurantiacus]MXO86168.1 hypothetical protein [Parapontixanthobacter aurantiacus]